MLSISITEKARQQEWNIFSIMTRNNGFPSQIIHNLKNNFLLNTHKQKAHLHEHNERNGSHLRITVQLYTKLPYLFKSTDLNIAFRACNTIYNQLCDRTQLNKMISSGMYKLQCKTCNKSYVGQTGSL
jgi:hypothetical protein